MMVKVYQRIKANLNRLLNSEQKQWLNAGLDKLSGSADLNNDLLMLSATTRRKLGSEFIDPEMEAMQFEPDLLFTFHNWTYADAGRALLVLQGAISGPQQIEHIIQEYFQQGDDAEIAVITRLAVLFDQAEALKLLLREVSRTNSMSLFAALAQYNPYPASYFTDHEFNQLVLKSLFMGISIDPISHLHKRANTELSLMCEEYIKERVAADRTIPADIWLVVEPFASSQGEALMIDHLTNSATEHRYFVVKALQQQTPLSSERQQLLDEHKSVEEDPRVLALYSN